MKPGSVFCPGLCLVPSDVNSTCQKVGVESPGSHQGPPSGCTLDGPWLRDPKHPGGSGAGFKL